MAAHLFNLIGLIHVHLEDFDWSPLSWNSPHFFVVGSPWGPPLGKKPFCGRSLSSPCLLLTTRSSQSRCYNCGNNFQGDCHGNVTGKLSSVHLFFEEGCLYPFLICQHLEIVQ